MTIPEIYFKEILSLLENDCDRKKHCTTRLLAGDGSTRRFYRIKCQDAFSCIAVLPAAGDSGLQEAKACFRIGRHLARKNIPVPIIFNYSPTMGIILYEDLGTELLHNHIERSSLSYNALVDLYRNVIDVLIPMQLFGGIGLDASSCWDTPKYDKEVMIERESLYFHREFCVDLLGLNPLGSKLRVEFERLAERASQEPAGYFLHRDFHSRNLMLCDGKVRIIDFQAGRFGPLAYDLASLMVDPYVSLGPQLQKEIVAYYISALKNNIPLDPERFLEGYYYMFLQRNLQILGAFSFLSNKKGKSFFRKFIIPALFSLERHLGEQPYGLQFPYLRGLVTRILKEDISTLQAFENRITE